MPAASRAALPPLWVALATSFALSLSSCTSDESEPVAAPTTPAGPRLVILYATCSLNRSFLSPYNDQIVFTPNLEKFARDAVVFRRHMTEAGQSGIAYAALFSGTDARGHGVFSHPTKIPDPVYLVGEAFAANGYDGHFWGGHLMASGEYAYGQGVPENRTFTQRLRAKDAEFQQLLRHLRDDPNAKAFVATTFTLTHSPYQSRNLKRFLSEYPKQGALGMNGKQVRKYMELHAANYKQLANNFPETVETLGLGEKQLAKLAKATELLYKSNVNLLDSEFGAILQAIEEYGLTDDSLVAFTSDHGETLYRESALFKWSHGWELAPEVLQIPWLVRAPKALGLRGDYGAVTRSIDVFPTLAGLAGLQLDPAQAEGISGVDLSDALRGRTPPPSLLAHSHTVVQHQRALDKIKQAALWLEYHKGVEKGEMWVSIRDADAFYRYRNLDGENWGFQAFDLATDPYAENDSFDGSNPTHNAMRTRLQNYRAELIQSWKEVGAEPIFDQAAEDALRGLGYIE